ncbi:MULTISPECIES: competence/damage-inducible protein A [unclassified Granulicatella]|uniref:competence/damage-inducible protein A n=1 Tax=unclassified Granulicatella TaxID=2630493 RepID=UPI00107383D0|nr:MULTISPECIES: competence/damage-inducible protein A [unclassified Granulicatella]MBF0779915.1 competence/damage-inducible protein A [Granulicatella sp. 19428wC4_WM01]TFU96026.1 competence/damage-inducible protein A [Granulicatella sp. WM01]
MQKAEIIAVGTELLMGQVVNTNATEIARVMSELSIPLFYQSVVGDNQERLIEQLRLASQRSNLIILCGGIGPTEDDLTKQALAKFLHLPLDYHQQTKEKIIHHFEQIGKKMPENNLRQALYFEQGIGLFNHNGFAVGLAITVEQVSYIVLPGPPNELMMMLEKEVKPYLSKQEKTVFFSKTLHFIGIGESKLATIIEEFIIHQTNPTLAIYATPVDVSVRITANGNSKEECLNFILPIQQAIEQRLSQYLYGYDDDTLAKLLVDKLTKHQLTLSVAESLTGGWAQKELVDVSGVSRCFKGGVVTYQKNSKQDVLHIPYQILEQYGTISQQCAKEMAFQVKKLFDSDIGLSFTGIADSQSVENKQSGTVFIGIAYKDNPVECYELTLHRLRNENRQLALRHGLNYLRKLLEDIYGN